MNKKQLQETVHRMVKEALSESYEDEVAAGDMSLRDMATRMADEEGIDLDGLELDQILQDLEGFTPGDMPTDKERFIPTPSKSTTSDLERLLRNTGGKRSKLDHSGEDFGNQRSAPRRSRPTRTEDLGEQTGGSGDRMHGDKRQSDEFAGIDDMYADEFSDGDDSMQDWERQEDEDLVAQYSGMD